jgi:hypothetical protein
MTTTLEIIRTVLENTDYKPRAYSGRYMHGKQCMGITCDTDAARLITTIMRGVVDELDGDDEAFDKMRDIIEAIDNPNTEAMGRSVIVYWPNIDWNEWEESEEESQDESDDEES